MKRALLHFIVLLFPACVMAQVSGVIQAPAANQSWMPVKGAQAFIRNTTLSATTDETGAFKLEGIPPGFVELVVYKQGFQLFKSPIRVVQGKASKLNLKLVPSGEGSESGRGDVAQALANFTNEFLGRSDFAKRCKINNPQVIQPGNKQDHVFVREPVVVDNLATGYRMTCFFSNDELDLGRIGGLASVKYDTLVAKGDQWSEWNRNREDAFFGSRLHFYWAMANGQAANQGFQLMDSEKRYVDSDSLVKPSKLAGFKRIMIPDTIEIRYQDEKDPEKGTSWISSPEPIDVSLSGIPLNDRAVTLAGAMKTGAGEWLPSDYFPASRMVEMDRFREIVRLYREQIYIHTDKPYYYPGEVVWLKGYVSTKVPQFKDSLSKVMYVEFISPDDNVLLSRRLKIEHGLAWGDFIMPDSLKAGNYYLRAYTSLQRNFGDGKLFVKKIPIMGITSRVDETKLAEELPGNQSIEIIPDKNKYKLREKVTLSLRLTVPGAQQSHLSVAVTDAVQVAGVRTKSITTDFVPDTAYESVPARLIYPIEKGISFSGQFLNDKGKPEKARITIIQGKMESMLDITTDNAGRFFDTGYDFYDSMEFRIQAKNAKGKVYGRVNLAKPEVPRMDFAHDNQLLPVILTGKQQRIISEYEVPMSARVLTELTVSAKRIVASEFVSKRYGTPNRIIGSEQIWGTDMLNSLLTTIPGLKVTVQGAGFSQVRTITMGHGIKYGSMTIREPLVYVDGVKTGGGRNVELNAGPGAVEALALVVPSQVDHVEVITSATGLIGVEEGGGLIAIFLKQGVQLRKSFETFMISGYDRPRDFRAPDYDSPETNPNLQDLRSTLYWNPAVQTNSNNEASVSFFASDLDGRYRVVVEGVTNDGRAVRGEAFINVSMH